MSDTVIKVENLYKQYRLGVVGTGTLSHDLNRWWHKVRGKEDPYLKIGETNDRTTKGNSEYVWALNDINFEVKRGEVLGIIGKNGAGKSTLLKLLSRVTTPTKGEIKAKGRIASLLEVGTGFHEELTGRENIFLNGAILGMSKGEIKIKLDEIIAFSGTERYIDTPVKRYSSGMRVRLAFAVAAHLDPEILIVDEVLAVGDADFQQKAIGKMQDVAQGSGRTVLFVSHNMAAVKSLCSRAVLLENGRVKGEGNTDKIVSAYLKGESGTTNYKRFINGEVSNEKVSINEVSVTTLENDFNTPLRITDHFKVTVKCNKKVTSKRFDITLHIKDEGGNYIFGTSSVNSKEVVQNEGNSGNYCFECYFPANLFNMGSFFIDILCVVDYKNIILKENDILSFTLIGNDVKIGHWMGKSVGPIKPQLEWKVGMG